MEIYTYTQEEALDNIIVYGRLLEALERQPDSKDVQGQLEVMEKRLERIVKEYK
jgi:hypothetical protein